jgi:hypothetical protein
MTTTSIEWIPASDIAVGDAVVEQDGYLFAVLEITRDRGVLVFRLANDFSPMSTWRSTGAGVQMRKRPSTKVAVVRGAGSDVVRASEHAGPGPGQ